METRMIEGQDSLDARIRQKFGLGQQEAQTYSPLVLAYIGDGIYELIIRTIAVGQGNRQVKKLHRQASRYAKAQAQSEMMETLLPLLCEEETRIYMRGRNAKSYSTAKNASVNDYRRATGFEALMGYLYLQGDMERLLELVKAAVDNYTPNEHTGTEARNCYESSFHNRMVQKQGRNG
ncbi:MAG: hypothetical protein K2N87_04225 [Eubacterium sp.]|nr:hypothetical protein [Eubacterium sp.]